eukprot:2458259-Rhodomonas_salina.2
MQSISLAQIYENHDCIVLDEEGDTECAAPGRVFITPPKGSNEEPDTVFEVLRQLYGIPSSARALHLTLTKWFKSQGFTTAGFEDSIWVRNPQFMRLKSRLSAGTFPE